jgi:hypothetical protein
MDPEGKGLTQAGWVLGIIGTILGCFWLLFCIAYIGFFVWMVMIQSTAMRNAATARGGPPAWAPPPPPPPPGPPPGRRLGGGGALRLQDYFPRARF